MNKKFFYVLLIFVSMGSFCAVAGNNGVNNSAAVNSKSNPFSRLRIGGNLSGGFNNDLYFLTIAPRVSMEVTKWFVPGVTVSYMYSQGTGDNKATTNTYGGGVFTDFYPIKYLFGRIEYQHLWYTQKIKGTSPYTYSSNDHFLLMGAGAKVPVSAKAAVSASVLFNVLNNERSEKYMFKNPIFSVGIDVGL